MGTQPEFERVYKDVIDYLMPLQTIYEHAFYHLLLRKSFLEGTNEIRVGQRALAKITPLPAKVGTSNKGGEIRRSSQAHVKEVIESLARKGHIEIGDTTFEGTLYRVKLPREIPECLARIEEAQRSQQTRVPQDDFYNIPENRRKVFERDNHCCRYCGIKVTPENATLDHVKPVSEGGDHSLRNLVTCCLKCNAIKAARHPDDSLLDILERYKATLRGSGETQGASTI